MLGRSDVDRNDAVGERDGSIRVTASDQQVLQAAGADKESIDLAPLIIHSDN